MSKLTAILGTICGVLLVGCVALGTMVIREQRDASTQAPVPIAEPSNNQSNDKEETATNEYSKDDVSATVNNQESEQPATEELSAMEEQTMEESSVVIGPGIEGYEVVRDDRSIVLDSDEVGEIFFDVVSFYGNDSTLVNDINQEILTIAERYFQAQQERNDYLIDSMETFLEREGSLQEEGQFSVFSFAPRVLSEVYYDDEYISVSWKCFWWAGGITSRSFDSIVYSINDAHKATIYELLGDDAENLIKEAVYDTCSDPALTFDYYDWDKLKYYLTEDEVVVTFASNELMQATASGTIVVQFTR